jgi:hypothetical protein
MSQRPQTGLTSADGFELSPPIRTDHLADDGPASLQSSVSHRLRLVRAEFTIRPSFRCDVKLPGVTLAVAPSDRQRCDQPLYVAHSRFHRIGTLIEESRGRDLVSGSVHRSARFSLVDRG